MDKENVNYTLYFLDEETEKMLKIKPVVKSDCIDVRHSHVEYVKEITHKCHSIGKLILIPRDNNMISSYITITTTTKAMEEELKSLRKELEIVINTLEQRGYTLIG